VTSQEIVEEFQQLEQKLGTLRTRAEEEESTLSQLEGQVHELSEKSVRTRREAAELESLLMQKRAEFIRAEYDVAFQAREQAAARLAEAISQALAEIDIYDRAQQALAALGGGQDRPSPRLSLRRGSGWSTLFSSGSPSNMRMSSSR